MYVLHYAPDNASLIIRLALEELGAAYQTRLVDRAAAAQRSEPYRALNPMGRIPVLETPDGALFETAAILLWLAEQHGALIPPMGAPARGRVLTWLMVMSNDLQSLMRLNFYTQRYAGPDRHAQAALRQTVQAQLAEGFAALEEAFRIRETTFLSGPAPGVLDCYLGPLLRWAALYPKDATAWFDLTRYPGLARAGTAMERRASGQAAIRAEGLGPTPFTAPRYPDPPEGSAT